MRPKRRQSGPRCRTRRFRATARRAGRWGWHATVSRSFLDDGGGHGGLRDADGAVVSGDQLEKTADFHAESLAWGMLYSAVPLTPKTDISKAVNQELARTHGDAIVNLKVMSSQCPADFAPLLNVIPFWPGCAKVVFEGTIVRVKRRAPALPTTSTPSKIASGTLEAQRL